MDRSNLNLARTAWQGSSSTATEPGAAPLSTDGGLILESDDEEARRKERNRESAKRSRELARQHVTMLEQNVALLAHDSQALLSRLAHVEAENAYLRQVHQQMIRQSVTENAAANAPATKNPGGVGDDEPAALMSQSLQRMPTLLLLLLSTAVQLLPLQDTVVPCPFVLSLETRGPKHAHTFLAMSSLRSGAMRRRRRLRGRSLRTSWLQVLYRASPSLAATSSRARLHSSHRRRHAPVTSPCMDPHMNMDIHTRTW